MNKNLISKTNKYILILTVLSISLFSYTPITRNVGTVHAQSTSKGEYTLLEPLPCIPGNGITCPADNSLKKSIDFQTYVQYAFNLLIGLSAAAAVLMMIVGGLQYMSTDSWQGKQDGLEKFKHAIYGLLLILSSYMILRTIDPRLVEIPSTIVPPITLKKSSVDYNSGKFFDQLISDAQTQQIISEQLIQEAKNIQQQTIALETEKKKIENQIDELYNLGIDETDPQMQKLLAEQKNLSDKINSNQGGMLRELTSASMSETLSKTDRELSVENAANTSKFLLFYTGAKLTKTQIDNIIDSSEKDINNKLDVRREQIEKLAPGEFQKLKDEANKDLLLLEIRRQETILANAEVSRGSARVGNETVDRSGLYQTITQSTKSLGDKVEAYTNDLQVQQDMKTRLKNIKDAVDIKFGK